MQLVHRKNRPEEQSLSPTVYAALVDSLFQNPAPMLAGAICMAIAAILTALKTGNVYLWPCAALIVLVGSYRAYNMYQYKRRGAHLSQEGAIQWEGRYRIGALLYAAVLGIWCTVVLLGSDDPVAHKDSSIIDRRFAWRDINPGMLDSQCAFCEFQGRVRSVARVDLDQPDPRKGNSDQNHKECQETEGPSTHAYFLYSEFIRNHSCAVPSLRV